MKSNILLIAPFISLKGEAYFNRFRYLALELVSLGYKVTVVTSGFEHFSKKHRSSNQKEYQEGYEIVLLPEKGYKSNVSINRILSHKELCSKLNDYLSNLATKPDLIYSAYPLICSNLIAGEYAQKHKIPFILDIQDVWPESISAFLGKLSPILAPIVKLFAVRADRAYNYADGLIAVSQTYLNRGMLKSKPEETTVAYIGADVEKINDVPSVQKEPNEFWAVYVGTLSYSYDMETVIHASALLQKKYENIKFLIIGKGQDKEKLEKLNHELNAGVLFMDAMPYDNMVSYLKSSDIGLNAIKEHAIQSITNKLSDYICTQTVVLSSSNNTEIKEMIEVNNIGMNYSSLNIEELASKIEYLYLNKDILEEYKANIDTLQNRFNRRIEYQKIYKMIDSLLESNN